MGNAMSASAIAGEGDFAQAAISQIDNLGVTCKAALESFDGKIRKLTAV